MTIDGYTTLGVDREYDLTDSVLLDAMDRSEVERAMIAAVDRCLAVDNREGNEFLARTASNHPDRLIPTCSANPWYGSGAVDECRRAIKAGARMLVLHPAVQGYQANDELVWPLLEVAVDEKVPVYVHTGPPGNATPWRVVDLADRFDGLELIIGHCGATDFWNDMAGAGQASDGVYFESSLARPFLFTKYLEAAGQHKGIMGSFAPINELTFEWGQMRGELSDEMWEDVLGGTLQRLLERRGAL